MNTRDFILNFLQSHTTASAIEISEAAGVTSANIRYHIKALLKSRQIEEWPSPTTALPPGRRGRPQYTYRLAAPARPDNLPRLSDALLQVLTQIETLLPSARPRNKEKSRSQTELPGLLPPSLLPPMSNPETPLEHLASLLAGPISPAQHLTQRLTLTIRRLNEQNYQARWEAHANSPRIIFHNCPYAAILPTHPELCQMDCHLLHSLLGLPVQLNTRMNLQNGSPAVCTFFIHATSLPAR